MADALQRLAQQADLGGLARPVAALEGDKYPRTLTPLTRWGARQGHGASLGEATVTPGVHRWL